MLCMAHTLEGQVFNAFSLNDLASEANWFTLLFSKSEGKSPKGENATALGIDGRAGIPVLRFSCYF